MSSTKSRSRWWHEGAAGAVAGVAQDTLVHPIDTLRARLDVAAGARAAGGASNAAHPLRALLAAARATLTREGVRGLYGGFGIAVLGGAISPTTDDGYSDWFIQRRAPSFKTPSWPQERDLLTRDDTLSWCSA